MHAVVADTVRPGNVMPVATVAAVSCNCVCVIFE